MVLSQSCPLSTVTLKAWLSHERHYYSLNITYSLIHYRYNNLEVGRCTWTLCTWLFFSFIWSVWRSDLFCRNGSCALCCRAEQICYAGSGLPHDSSEHDFSGGHQDREGPPWCHPKPRFPSAAQRFGQRTARQPQCNIKPLVASEFNRSGSGCVCIAVNESSVFTYSEFIPAVLLRSVEMPYYIRTSINTCNALFTVKCAQLFTWPPTEVFL